MTKVDLDRALAQGIDRGIQRHREAEPASWSNRDVAQRMTNVGYPMQHPAVVLTRQGKRKVGAAEWMVWALVLSVQPLSLLDVDADVAVGAHPVSFKELQTFIHGRSPLPAVKDPGWFYNSFSRLSDPEESVFATQIGGLVADFLTTGPDFRQALLEKIARAAVDQMTTERQVEQVVQRRQRADHGVR